MQTALQDFEKRVRDRYTEGTLHRLLAGPDPVTRAAAVLAVGLVGTMKSNRFLAAVLKDEDRTVRQLAPDALWSLWFRADSEANNLELRRLMRVSDPKKAIAGLGALIKKSPRFAEAFNQRAILFFRLEDFPRSIVDCDMAAKLNPYHFGALAGMGQSYMKLKKPRAALKAFRAAYQINPGLEGIEETIQFLEDALGEEGRKDDKK
jgi:tetratricopeptide (TPR) repeat protein